MSDFNTQVYEALGLDPTLSKPGTLVFKAANDTSGAIEIHDTNPNQIRQLFTVFDHLGSPIASIGNVGGIVVFGDDLRDMTGDFKSTLEFDAERGAVVIPAPDPDIAGHGKAPDHTVPGNNGDQRFCAAGHFLFEGGHWRLLSRY